ncbi:MAG: glycosyl transferase group 1 [Phycisphaeraceae bacterium]|nr:glycosyl transferase group 1 [Phycisphaeraceae bacterium]
MRIIQLTPGTGSFHCGSCLRDHALVRALHGLGHRVTMVPMYLPLVVEHDDEHAAPRPVRYGGVNVYLQQKAPWLRRTPAWLHRLLDSPRLLRRVARRSGMTRARLVGDITLSVLNGEDGRQKNELDRLVASIADEQPDVVCLSNALLVGLAGAIRARLRVPVVCTLQGEDAFLDALPESVRDEAWRTLARRAADVDALIGVSRYYADTMTRRLGLASDRVHVVHNGIDLEGFPEPGAAPDPPVLGYFARMCADKGLGTLIDAFLQLKCRPDTGRLRLHVAGAMTRSDEAYVRALQQRLGPVADDVRWQPNPDRRGKLDMLAGLSVFSVPATYGEAFGLYVIEALASGVPVVQPRHGAFEEVIGATGGGVLCAADDPTALADAIETLIVDEPKRRALAAEGRRNVHARFGADRMAAEVIAILESVQPRD